MTRRVQLIRTVVLSLCSLISLSYDAAGVNTQKSEDKLHIFAITQEPGQADWKHFLQMSEKERSKLWNYHVDQNKKWQSWSWGWRLGWLRSCKESRTDFCRKIFLQGLSDRSAVVRAEAATWIGVVYEESADQGLAKELAKAFKDKRNYRNQKPLFVQKRILWALHSIGGKEIKSLGTKITRADRESAEYWRKISRI